MVENMVEVMASLYHRLGLQWTDDIRFEIHVFLDHETKKVVIIGQDIHVPPTISKTANILLALALVSSECTPFPHHS